MEDQTIDLSAEREGLPLASYLASLPADQVHSLAHRARHLGAIYSLSSQRVWLALEQCLIEHNVLLSRPPEDGDAAKLLERTVSLIAAARAHVDDCFQILKVCSPPDSRLTDPFAERWLKAAGHPTIGEFKSNIAIYLSHLNYLNNAIKHSNGWLGSLSMTIPEGRIIGYYLESVTVDGTIGPDSEFHPHSTALSFNCSLRYHAAHLLGMGLELKKALQKALGGHKVHDSIPNEGSAPTRAAFLRSIDLLLELKTLYFPDEARASRISIDLDRKNSLLKIRFNSMKKFPKPISWSVKTNIPGDGYSTTFALPYFGNENIKYWVR